VPIPEFVDKELVLFSRADVERSIPSVVDGLKPSQRKVLYAAFKRKLTSDVKVAQFAGYVAEHTAYHHGEASLVGTIVGMAHDFVGSNNANYLVPSGQFGTRLMGGKDAASARYIFTRLAPVARTLFHPDDDASLEYLDDDGDSIEPRYYVPVLPALLINGSSGIGTGWSTEIPAYDPAEVAANVERMIRREELVAMTPWYRGFTGSIERVSDDAFVTKGTFRVSGKTVIVTELPVGRWTQDVKDHLETLLEKKVIVDYKENHTDTSVRFDIEFAETPSDPASVLKLETTVRTSNMHAFDADGNIAKYGSPEDILRAWYAVRERAYEARKTRMLADIKKRMRIARNKSTFVDAVVSGALVVSGRPMDDVIADTRRIVNDDDAETLLSMDIRSLTAEKAEKYRQDVFALNDERETVHGTSIEDMWTADLREALSRI
jgi:DNA topoisomerase-2